MEENAPAVIDDSTIVLLIVRKERGYDFIIDISDTTLAAWDTARYDFRKMNDHRQRKKLFELGICDFPSQYDITDSMITVMNNE